LHYDAVFNKQKTRTVAIRTQILQFNREKISLKSAKIIEKIHGQTKGGTLHYRPLNMPLG